MLCNFKNFNHSIYFELEARKWENRKDAFNFGYR